MEIMKELILLQQHHHFIFMKRVKAGDFVYVSGQASVDRENGSIIEGTFEEEMRRSIENLEVILKEAGLTLDNVINIKSYVADQKDLKEYNKIYPEYFKDPQPTCGVAPL